MVQLQRHSRFGVCVWTRCAALLTICLAPGLRAEPPEPLAVFVAKEHLGIDWPRTLVTYRVTFATPVAPDDTRLLDTSEREVAFQLSNVQPAADGRIASAWVSFFAELEKYGEYRFALMPGLPTSPSNVRATAEDDHIMLENQVTAVRLPSGRRRFETPVSLADAKPGPILGVRLLDGTWTAPATFENLGPTPAPRITGWETRITATGPLFAEARVTYQFDNGGTYTLMARLVDGEPGIRIDEQVDLQIIRGERDWRVAFPLTDLSGRFRPDVAWWSTPHGRLHKIDEAFERAVEAGGYTALTPQRDGNRRHLSSMGFQPDAERQTIVPIAAWYPYHPVAHYVAVASRASLKPQGDTPRDRRIPFAGVMTLHAGNWRGIPENYNGELIVESDGSIKVTWPLTVSPHPNSVLHTGEFDPYLPYTFIRRQWSLLAGPMQYHDELLAFRRYQGYVNLDDYKDWVLDWPEDAAVTYPRLVVTRDRVEAMREGLDRHPMKSQLQQLLFFNDDPKRAASLMKSLESDNMWSGARGHVLRCLGRDAESMRRDGWVAGFRHSQKGAWTHAADELLASEHLTPEDRSRLRAWIAAACYALSEPDFNPRGTMVHLGNPNMPMNRFFALTFAAALIPDHPQATTWLETSRQYVRYILSRNTAPHGSWSELLTYYMSGASHALQAALVLHNQNLLDDVTASQAMTAGRYPLSLVSPHDPRFDARALPAWGHEGYWMIPTQWLAVAAIAAERDPALSRALKWAWDALGRPVTDHHDAGFSSRLIAYADLRHQPDPPQAWLASRWIPGFGATMRAHIGEPNETFLAYRQGYMVSHSDANQGDFLIYAKGAALTAPALFQYAIYDKRPFEHLYRQFGWHNRVRFGEMSNYGGWPGGGMVSQVHRFSAADAADYLRGFGHYDGQQWTRQIIFLKSPNADGPNYFLMQDSFAVMGDESPKTTWWYLRTDGSPQRLAPRNDGFTYASPQGAKLDVTFLAPAEVTLESREATQQGPLFNRVAELWREAGGAIDGTQVEQTMTVTAAGPIPAGQDITVVLCPLSEGETRLKYQRLAAGATQIVTAEGTDVVFLAAEPMTYRDERIAFEGRAGAVRLRGDEVHLVIAEGPARVRYEQVELVSDVPAERVIPLRIVPSAGQQRQIIRQQAVAHAIRLDEPAADASVQSPQPGVLRWHTPAQAGWVFDAADPRRFELDGGLVHGRRGCIITDSKLQLTTLTLLDGARIGAGGMAAWGDDGPYTLTFHADRITGRAAGLERFLYVTRPAGLQSLPTLVIDGIPTMPGLAADLRRRDIATTGDPFGAGGGGGTMIVPLHRGEFDFELCEMDQPAIFRNWQAWPDMNSP